MGVGESLPADISRPGGRLPRLYLVVGTALVLFLAAANALVLLPRRDLGRNRLHQIAAAVDEHTAPGDLILIYRDASVVPYLAYFARRPLTFLPDDAVGHPAYLNHLVSRAGETRSAGNDVFLVASGEARVRAMVAILGAAKEAGLWDGDAPAWESRAEALWLLMP